MDPRWVPDALGKPPRPGDTGATLPAYGEDRHGSLAQDMAALAGVVTGTVVPLTMTMAKWNETYDERSLELKRSDRKDAAELMRTYALTSALVTPVTAWGGFMAGGGYRQKPLRAFLCGVGASALALPLGSYLGGLVVNPITDIDGGAQPRFPDRTMFMGSLVSTGFIASSTIAGVVVGGGEIVRKVRDPGYTLNVVKQGEQVVWVPGVQLSF